MGKDYSDTVLGDGFFMFRKCCFCGGREDLSRVAVSAYSGYEWYYFHDACLEEVANNPEKHIGKVDYALEIQNDILSHRTWRRNKVKEIKKNADKLRKFAQ